MDPLEQKDSDRTSTAARKQLDPAVFEAGLEKGAGMTPEEAVARVLGTDREHTPLYGRPDPT